MAFTKSGEWIAYDFSFDDDDVHKYSDSDGKVPLEVTIRAAAPSDRKVDLKIQSQHGSTVDEKVLVVPGKGYQTFNDVIWQGIKVHPRKKHLRLYIFFIAGTTNLCSIKVKVKRDHGGGSDDDDDDDDDSHPPVTRYVPFALNALEYDDSHELDDAVYGQCENGQPPIDEPDAQTTTDSICKELGPCHVSHTYEGEKVAYNFKSNGNEGKKYADITARVATASGSHKTFTMAIKHGDNLDKKEYFKFKGDGYQNFEDVNWYKVPIDTSYDTHVLEIGFENGNINLCSVEVAWHDHQQPTSPPHPVSKPTLHPASKPTPRPVAKPSPGPPTHTRDTVPATFAAFDFDHAYDKSPDHSQGNCYEGHKDGVDGKVTSDSVCIHRDNSHCQVGWTEPKGMYDDAILVQLLLLLSLITSLFVAQNGFCTSSK